MAPETIRTRMIQLLREEFHRHLPRRLTTTSGTSRTASTLVPSHGNNNWMPGWTTRIEGWPSTTLEPRSDTPSR
ncbi:hypothetical protein LINGRAHAP2_LOCUS30221 [Linum grandiflorum]